MELNSKKIPKIGDSMHITDADYRPLPRIPGVKPKRPLHDLDRLQGRLEEARSLYEDILGHSKAWHESIAERQHAKVHPAGPGTPLRNFIPIDPAGEWMIIDKQPARAISTLQSQGLIACLDFEGHWRARPGVAK